MATQTAGGSSLSEGNPRLPLKIHDPRATRHNAWKLSLHDNGRLFTAVLTPFSGDHNDKSSDTPPAVSKSARQRLEGLTAQVKGVFQIVRVHSGRSAVKTRDQGDMARKGGEGMQLPVFC